MRILGTCPPQPASAIAFGRPRAAAREGPTIGRRRRIARIVVQEQIRCARRFQCPGTFLMIPDADVVAFRMLRLGTTGPGSPLRSWSGAGPGCTCSSSGECPLRARNRIFFKPRGSRDVVFRRGHGEDWLDASGPSRPWPCPARQMLPRRPSDVRPISLRVLRVIVHAPEVVAVRIGVNVPSSGRISRPVPCQICSSRMISRAASSDTT